MPSATISVRPDHATESTPTIARLDTLTTAASTDLSPLLGLIGIELRMNSRARVTMVGGTNRYWVGGPEFIQPVEAVVELGDGECVAQSPETGIFGVGSMPAEALSDLRAALREHRDVLESSAPLSEGLREQLAFLRSVLR